MHVVVILGKYLCPPGSLFNTLNIEDCFDKNTTWESRHVARRREAQQGWLPANPIAESWSPLAQELRHHQRHWCRRKGRRRAAADGSGRTVLWSRPHQISPSIDQKCSTMKESHLLTDTKRHVSPHTEQQKNSNFSRLFFWAATTPKQERGHKERRRSWRTLKERSSFHGHENQRWLLPVWAGLQREFSKELQRGTFSSAAVAEQLMKEKERAGVFVFFLHDIMTWGLGNSSQLCQV